MPLAGHARFGCAVRKVRRALRDVKTRLFASERMWCALVTPGEQDVFATLLRGGEAAAADACTVEQLRYVLCAVSREGKTLGALTLP
ncbi:hypothetical protein FA95DRAFT_1565536 [Auriscalpium vulgare]|uniref:Uncharacterized protein n=1 Tax=Auriscalpium vulgare TaxID=40419 RepID=A0ACB8RAX2_9AGAM|nr:hypothetical protein FA95DRAFT_1565536 [Auriscalpium vulgare]